ncbi:hypothetical protein FZC33_06100 [Labrys sp. KNU-23]|uniref:hypothetical protein n=1 Tax=Labrys sp. KNU-23 TaxID=2789216 RepID=UPI0011F0741C|nr:hypothetical protein [Labrys sp. KNU-23]QEN85802.1 hypothetical protein FZC33_06100 [Labrys sp. KNU-23]
MKIATIHDIFRSSTLGMPEADPVIGHWFYNRFLQILRPLRIEVERVSILVDGEPSILEGLAARHGWPRNKSGWAYVFSHPDAASVIMPTLERLRAFDLVLGFEMPPNLIRALHAHGQKLIDISIDPVRFCEDLFLRMRSNDPVLQTLIAEQSVPSSLIVAGAAELRARIQPLPAQPEAIVFAGQVPDDSSLIAGSRIQSATPFADRLNEIAAGRQILLKPHPYAPANPDLATLHHALPKSRFTRDNIYALMAAPWLGAVVTLSSSVATEALYFDKPAIRLIDPDVEFVEPGVIGPFQRIDARASSAPFWGKLLDQAGQTQGPAPPVAPLRRLFGANWGLPRPATVTASSSLSRGETTTNIQPYCVFGWSGAEPDGVWSDGTLAVLQMPACNDGLASTLVLTLSAFAPDADHQQELAISSGSVGFIDKIVLATAERRELQIALPLVPAGSMLEISIGMDTAISPKELGINSDERRLGIKLHRMKIV